jgi:hypothetical protein
MGSLAPTAAHTVRGCKGFRQARSEEGHAHGRGTGFEAVEASSAPLTTTMARTAQGDPRRKRTSNHPASWVASHQGRVRFKFRISERGERGGTVNGGANRSRCAPGRSDKRQDGAALDEDVSGHLAPASGQR